jgi:hypothetical protein
VPARHPPEQLAVGRPVTFPNLPAGQSVHVDTLPVEYNPEGQGAVQLGLVRPVELP